MPKERVGPWAWVKEASATSLSSASPTILSPLLLAWVHAPAPTVVLMVLPAAVDVSLVVPFVSVVPVSLRQQRGQWHGGEE